MANKQLKIILTHKIKMPDDEIDRFLGMLRQTWEGEEVTSGRDFHKRCVETGEFEGWPQWSYRVSQDFDILVSPETSVGKATHEMLDRAITEGKEVWVYLAEDNRFAEVIEMEVIPKAEGGSWADYARLIFEEE